MRTRSIAYAKRVALLGLPTAGVAISLIGLSASCTHPEIPHGVAGAVDTNGGSGSGGTPNAVYDGGGSTDESTDGAAPVVVKASCTDSPYADPWSPGYTPNPTDQSNAKTTAGSMSIAELQQQMSGTDPGGYTNYADIFRTPDNANKGVKGWLFRDGPRGLVLAAELPLKHTGYSTAFPVAIARGAAFDMDLEYRIGVAIGDETVASGHTMILAPAVNILRHPAWGRAQETYGEDSYLLGRIGTAFVSGVQTFVPACAKHYAANNIENGRAADNSQMDEQTLQEVYARHFGAIIHDSGVACIMAAYNLVNSTKATQSKHLLTDILRTEFGFKGFILTDWWAMPPGTSQINPDARQANAIEAINAGLDMELPWSYNYAQLGAVTGAGKPLSQQQLVDATSRILEQKYRFHVAKIGDQLGLQRAKTTFNADLTNIENNEDHVALSNEAAIKSMVLLKNDKNTLPIDKSKVHKIAVVGAKVPFTLTNAETLTGTIDLPKELRLGDSGSSRTFADPAKSSTPFQGVKNKAGSGITVVAGNDASVASDADFVVVVVGLTPQDEGEEYTGAGDRANFSLDGKTGSGVQNALVSAVAAMGKPMVVVIEGGSVIDMPWLGAVPAVVMAWYPGMDGGNALASMLFGEKSFSGKLPITWPKSWNDEPQFHTGASTSMDFYLGYRYFDTKNIKPLYPFGYGLSYSTFDYKYIQVPCSDVTKDGVVKIKANVQNTGTVAADEVSFLFVSFPDSKVRRSPKELKGFHRVSLNPGEIKTIEFDLRVSDLSYFDTAANKFQVESGSVKIMIGPSSDNLPLTDTMTIK